MNSSKQLNLMERILFKGALKTLNGLIGNESLEFIAMGQRDDKPGLVAVTNKRVAFVNSVAKMDNSIVFLLENITSVETIHELLHSKIAISTPKVTLLVEKMKRVKANILARLVQK